MGDRGLSESMIRKLWGELFRPSPRRGHTGRPTGSEGASEGEPGGRARRRSWAASATSGARTGPPTGTGTTRGLSEQPPERSPPGCPGRRESPERILRDYQRRDDDFDMVVMACFAMGSSTRKSALIGELFAGTKICAGTVSDILKRVDSVLAGWRRRELEDRYGFLILDGLSVPVRMVHNRRRMVPPTSTASSLLHLVGPGRPPTIRGSLAELAVNSISSTKMSGVTTAMR